MFLLYGENDIFSDKQNPRVVRGFCVFCYRNSCHTVRIKSVISGRLLITNLITTAAVHKNTLNITTSMTSFAIFSRSINLSSGVMTGKASRCGVTGISASVMSVLLLLAKGIACLILCKKYFQNIKNLLNNCITKSWEVPPLAWGRDAVIRLDILSGGLPPTHVGKREFLRAARFQREDYPHSRGEKVYSLKRNIAQRGLPPLAWGKVACAENVLFQSGITPTRVGKSHVALRSAYLFRDYPHSRGEESKKSL